MSNYSDKNNIYPKMVPNGTCYMKESELYNAWKEGYLAAEKELGWHRNCEETPVPTHTIDARFNNDRIDMLRYNERMGWYYSGYYLGWVKPAKITHWREIPEVAE